MYSSRSALRRIVKQLDLHPIWNAPSIILEYVCVSIMELGRDA